MSPLRTLLLASGLALLGSSCGGDEDLSVKEQMTAARKDLQKKDHEAALGRFKKIMESADASEDEKFRAQRDSLVCIAKVDGDEAFTDALATFVEAHEPKVTVDVVAKFATDLAGIEKYGLAVDMMTDAKDKLSTVADEAKREEIDNTFKALAKRIEASGKGGDHLARLQALGYLGSD